MKFAVDGPGGQRQAYAYTGGKRFDPSLPANSIIQDLGLAPRNARGMVEYTSDVEMLRPADPAKPVCGASC